MTPEEQDLVRECASSYLFNLIYIADQEDEGGFDHPLEAKYAGFSEIVEDFLQQEILAIEAYEEDGESGEELVPGPKSDSYLNKLIKTSGSFQGRKLEGLESLRAAYYLKMDEGSLGRIPEDRGPWYQQLLDIEFYRSLAPESAPAPEPTPAPSAPPAPKPAARVPTPEDFREPERSAIEIQHAPDPADALPSKTYLYKKPTLIWLGLTALFILIGSWGGFFFFLALASAAFTAFYAYRKVIIGPEGVRFVSMAGSTLIPLDQIDQTDLTEEDNDPSELVITSRQGDSIKISDWLDDLRGAINLLKNHLRQQG